MFAICLQNLSNIILSCGIQFCSFFILLKILSGEFIAINGVSLLNFNVVFLTSIFLNAGTFGYLSTRSTTNSESSSLLVHIIYLLVSFYTFVAIIQITFYVPK